MFPHGNIAFSQQLGPCTLQNLGISKLARKKLVAKNHLFKKNISSSAH